MIVVLKIMKVLTAFIIIVTLCYVNNVKAISDEDYDSLREIFSDARLSIMTEEQKDMLVNGNLTTNTKTYATTQTLNGTYVHTEVDAETAELIKDSFNSGISTYDATHQTSYKRITIIDNDLGNSVHRVMVYTQWLVTPATTSFDVTAMRIDGGYVVDGTQDGTQVYWKDGEYGHVTYSWNGTNIRKFDNGFGISMNLVNDASYFETDISANLKVTTSNAEAFGTYQHAVTNVSLDQSQSYTISHNGLGGVLNFTNSVYNYYDRMTGVSISL